MTERAPVAPAPATRRATVVRHLVLSTALWATYVLYWRIVLSRGVRYEVGLSFALLGLFVVLQILFTQAWIRHNRRLSAPDRDRRRERTPAPAPPVTDFLGRRLSTWPPDSDLTRVSCIVVRVDEREKRFETGLQLGSVDAPGPSP